MKSGHIARGAFFSSGLSSGRVAVGALAAMVLGCSSSGGSEAPEASSVSPAASDEDASLPAGAPNESAPSPEASAGAMGEGDSAAGSSEGQPVAGLAPAEVEPGSGASSSAGGDEPTGDEAAGDETAGEDGAIDTPPPPEGLPPPVPSSGCGKARTLQDGTLTIASGGIERSYFLETPDGYDDTYPHRVVFMFHWNYGSIGAIVNPPDADRNTDRPFYGLGDLTDGRTIFVVPQGLVNPNGGAGWANPNDRDVIFTDDMLAAISNDLCIDTSRVFTTGFSYGAGMSVALACVRPDKFRAAVVYAPAFISGVAPAQCTTPVAFFESHGVDDPVINYPTGLNVLGTFTGLNGCAPATPPTPPADGHVCTSFEGCSVPTRFCSFGAGQGNPFNTSLRGHYPTSKDPGQATSWVPAEAWAFITQF